MLWCQVPICDITASMKDERTDPQYKIRWSADLRDRLAEAAKANKRSLNAEIIARLEESVARDRPLSEEELDERLESLSKKLNDLSAAIIEQARLRRP